MEVLAFIALFLNLGNIETTEKESINEENIKKKEIEIPVIKERETQEESVINFYM